MQIISNTEQEHLEAHLKHLGYGATTFICKSILF
jgi:hypothetical protein